MRQGGANGIIWKIWVTREREIISEVSSMQIAIWVLSIGLQIIAEIIDRMENIVHLYRFCLL